LENNVRKQKEISEFVVIYLIAQASQKNVCTNCWHEYSQKAKNESYVKNQQFNSNLTNVSEKRND
jgi:hypothetical protein